MLVTACGTHTYHIVQRGDSLYSIGWSYGYDARDLAQWNGLKAPYELQPGQRIRLVPPPGAKPAQVVTKSAAPPKVIAVPRSGGAEPASGGLAWSWPTEGKVIVTFDANDARRKGIDIAGVYGQPVRAAAAGKVVYSGSGLVGYGKLIILKHNETWLSAYAHNKELFVGEGESVEAGREISQMGSSGENVATLHFEIRRDGQPVDPLAYLPARSLQ